MARRSIPPDEQISIRLPGRLITRIDSYEAHLQARPPAGATRVTRALALRLALERGLEVVEAEMRARGDSRLTGKEE